ncbi:MAG: hypothetical protein EA374_06325 [Acholeplasmatales bacterium]|nr:MAG: hypothetical protein EA374_06325 [Acholeplasmatales bacterium]
MHKIMLILRTQPALFGMASILTGIISLWVFYISPLPLGLAVYGLVKTKHRRDDGHPSHEALVMNFIGLALGAFSLIVLVFILVIRLAAGLLPA